MDDEADIFEYQPPQPVENLDGSDDQPAVADFEEPDPQLPEDEPLDFPELEEAESNTVSREDFDALAAVVAELTARLEAQQQATDDAGQVETDPDEHAIEIPVDGLDIDDDEAPEPASDDLLNLDSSDYEAAPIFLAEEGASPLQFDELVADGGALAISADALRRQCASDTDTSALITLAANQFAVVPLLDYNGGDPCWRNVKIGGGSGRLLLATMHGNLDCPEAYEGYLVTTGGSFDISSTDTWDATDLGTTDTENPIVMLNINAHHIDGHTLTETPTGNSLFWVSDSGIVTTEATPRKVYLIQGVKLLDSCLGAEGTGA
jgi:hypothetical protein